MWYRLYFLVYLILAQVLVQGTCAVHAQQNGIRTNPAPESDEQQSGVSSIPVASQDARVPDTSEDEPQSESEISGFDIIKQGPNSWVSPDGLSGSVQTLVILTILSMAPAILLMTTCYVRIIIVLGILKQAIGLQALPPTQVMTSIALFMTLFVMTPVWQAVYKEAIEPYSKQDSPMSLEEAYDAGVRPVRQFMSNQIDITGNHDDVHLFYDYMDKGASSPSSFEDVPLRVLLPAFVLSELKTAFLMGFQIFLPFLVVDLVVASVTISMGMLMLPPQVVSLPFKLLLFVLVDGWRLVVQMLMDSFGVLF